MNTARVKYLPKFICENLEACHGIQAILAIPMKSAFIWEWIGPRKHEIRNPSPLFNHELRAATQPMCRDLCVGDVPHPLENINYIPSHRNGDGLKRDCKLVCPSHCVVH